MLPMVEFVEDERDLAFEHPVSVEFLDEEAWREQADIDEEEILDEDARCSSTARACSERSASRKASSTCCPTRRSSAPAAPWATTRSTTRRSGSVGRRSAPRSPRRWCTSSPTSSRTSTSTSAIGWMPWRRRTPRRSPSAVLVEGDADRIEDLWVESLSVEEREALDAAPPRRAPRRARPSPSCRRRWSPSSPAATSWVPASSTSWRRPRVGRDRRRVRRPAGSRGARLRPDLVPPA